MTFVKQKMLIGTNGTQIETDIAFGITGTYDMDAVAPTLEFSLPYLLPGQYSTSSGLPDLTKLKKYDTVKLYYAEFTSNPGDVSYTVMTKIFDGYIENVKLSKTKESFTYAITCYGTAGLLNSRPAFCQVSSNQLEPLLVEGLKRANLTDIVPLRFVDLRTNTLAIIIEGGKDLKEVTDQIKEKYAVIITQSGDGYLNVFTPSFLLNNRTDSFFGSNAWNFSFDDNNIWELDYGEITSNVNAVVVQGYTISVGMAIDVIGVQNNNGITNYQAYERPDLVGEEACQQYAREKLLELQRNFLVTVKTKFDPNFMVGQAFTVDDNDKFTGAEIFTIKKYVFTLDKEDVSCVISGFTFSLTVLPENLVLANSGIADVDIIKLRGKEKDFLGKGERT